SYRTVVLYSTVLHGYGTVQYYQEEILRRARGRTGECGRRNRPVRASPPGDHPGGHRGVPAARIPRRDHGRGRRPRIGVQADPLQALPRQAAVVRRGHPGHDSPGRRRAVRRGRRHAGRRAGRAQGTARPGGWPAARLAAARFSAAAPARDRRGRPLPRGWQGLVRPRLRPCLGGPGRGTAAPRRPRPAARPERPDTGRLPVRWPRHVPADEPGHVQRDGRSPARRRARPHRRLGRGRVPRRLRVRTTVTCSSWTWDDALGGTLAGRERPVRVCSPARIGYSSETRVILVGGARRVPMGIMRTWLSW